MDQVLAAYTTIFLPFPLNNPQVNLCECPAAAWDSDPKINFMEAKLIPNSQQWRQRQVRTLMEAIPYFQEWQANL